MSYWFGTAVGDLLFEGFTVTSTAGRHNIILISASAFCMNRVFTYRYSL